MRTKLNETMLKHEFPKPKFKGFMPDNAQANWNTIRIIYGFRDLFVKMVNKECAYLFHWTQSFNKHSKQLIKPKLQDQHNVLCNQHKNAKSFVEVDDLYVIIRCWWLSLGVVLEIDVHELANWFNF